MPHKRASANGQNEASRGVLPMMILVGAAAFRMFAYITTISSHYILPYIYTIRSQSTIQFDNDNSRYYTCVCAG